MAPDGDNGAADHDDRVAAPAETPTETSNGAPTDPSGAVSTPGSTPAHPWRAPLAVAASVVVADQLSKHWALNRLSDGRVIEVVWTLQFNLAFNSGMAFSRGQGFGPIIAVVATLVIVWLLVSLRTGGGRLNTFGIGCVIGGAAGNLIDRVFRQEAWLRGSVVDFIDFQWFPIFNVADIAINVGAAALILNAILTSRRARVGTS